MESVTNENFNDKVLNSPKPVLLEFYSDSCIPCKRLSPVLAEIEEEYESISFAKINVNFNGDTAKKYNVMSSPTILFFVRGQEVKRIRGFVKRFDLENAVKEVLQND